jgi:hypothetical protein
MKEAANQGGLFLFGHSTRSITLGKDEAHIVHILHRKAFDIRMINVHLENVHIAVGARLSNRRREEKQLRSERDQDSCDYRDAIM